MNFFYAMHRGQNLHFHRWCVLLRNKNLTCVKINRKWLCYGKVYEFVYERRRAQEKNGSKNPIKKKLTQRRNEITFQKRAYNKKLNNIQIVRLQPVPYQWIILFFNFFFCCLFFVLLFWLSFQFSTNSPIYMAID